MLLGFLSASPQHWQAWKAVSVPLSTLWSKECIPKSLVQWLHFRTVIRVQSEGHKLNSEDPTYNFWGDWSWNNFYDHSLPTTNSIRAVVSYWRTWSGNKVCGACHRYFRLFKLHQNSENILGHYFEFQHIPHCLALTIFSQRFLCAENTHGITILQAISRVF